MREKVYWDKYYETTDAKLQRYIKPDSFGDWNTDHHKKGCISWNVGINMADHLTHQTVKYLSFISQDKLNLIGA